MQRIYDLRSAASKDASMFFKRYKKTGANRYLQAAQFCQCIAAFAMSDLQEMRPFILRQHLNHPEAVMDGMSTSALGKCGCTGGLCEKIRNKFWNGI